MTTDINDTLRFSIVAGRHGGIAVYEAVDDAYSASPVFAGNLEEFTTYINARTGVLLHQVSDAYGTEVGKPTTVKGPLVGTGSVAMTRPQPTTQPVVGVTGLAAVKDELARGGL